MVGEAGYGVASTPLANPPPSIRGRRLEKCHRRHRDGAGVGVHLKDNLLASADR